MGLASYRKKFIIEEQLENLILKKSWKKDLFVRCFSCDEIISEMNGFQTQFGLLCRNCIEKEIKERVTDRFSDISDVQNLLEKLDSGSNVVDKILLYHKLESEIVKEISAEQKEKLFGLAIKDLSYSGSATPLDFSVRDGAGGAILFCGVDIIPRLLKAAEKEDEDFYVRTVKIGLELAPDDESVVKLCLKASTIKDLKIKKQILNILSSHYTLWSKRIIEKFAHDKNETFRKLAIEKVRIIDNVISNNNLEIQRTNKRLKKQQEKNDRFKLDQKKGGVIKCNFVDSKSDLYRKLYNIIDENYTATNLKRLFPEYLKPFFSAEYFDMTGKISLSKLKKVQLADALTIIFADKDNFLKFINLLGEKFKACLTYLAFSNDILKVSEVEERFEVDIIDKKKNIYAISYSHVSTEFILFQYFFESSYYNDTNYIYFDEKLAKHIVKYLQLPDSAKLIPLDKLPEKTEYVYEDKDEIIQNFGLYVDYIEQGNLKLSKSNGKPLKSAYLKMIDNCKIKEFYPDQLNSEEGVIKCRLLCDILCNSKFEDVKSTSSHLKKIFTNFLNYKNFKEVKFQKLLWYLKGTSYYFHDEIREKLVRKSLKQLLMNLPENSWISFENLTDHVKYNKYKMDIIPRDDSDYYITDYYHQRDYLSEKNYSDMVFIPFLKTIFFLFASLGLIDVAYNKPENKRITQNEKSYLSLFDGLQYIKLTNLGAYILGKRKSYDVKVKKEEIKLVLDHKRLIVSFSGSNRIVEMFLESLGERIAAKSFKIGFNSFLRECKIKEDIDRKINSFKKFINEKLPPIWSLFLEEVKNKINPLQEEDKYRIFKIDNDRELLSLFAGDPILKKMVLKAEEYHILIDRTNIRKVKKRLEEFGYFIDKM